VSWRLTPVLKCLISGLVAPQVLPQLELKPFPQCSDFDLFISTLVSCLIAGYDARGGRWPV